jgi:16S rRNA (cytidine1402-2'-O)-methyltransferase
MSGGQVSERDGGRLVLVATPIGNLDDLSDRAVAALRDADLVAAEDTRRTGRLLAHVGAETPQVSYHDHSPLERTGELVERVRAGDTVVLVTDAGTPSVSDPGYRLVRACLDADLPVEAVPGPSAVLHALVVSGLPTDRFAFDGFLPRRGSARGQRLAEIADEPRTTVLFLSPHRADRDLADLAEACGADRAAALCRELTKLHEEVRRGPLGELAAAAERDGIRGEVTLVVAGAPPTPSVEASPAELAREVELRTAAGLDKKDAIAEVAAEAGVAKREVYQAVLDAGG